MANKKGTPPRTGGDKRKKIDPLCGGQVVWYTPPNPKHHPHYRCRKCGRSVPDYEIVRRRKRAA